MFLMRVVSELTVRCKFTEGAQELFKCFFGFLFSSEEEVSVESQITDFFKRVLTPFNHIFERTFLYVYGRLFTQKDLATFGVNGKEQEIH